MADQLSLLGTTPEAQGAASQPPQPKAPQEVRFRARVFIEGPLDALDYRIPDALIAQVNVGMGVTVPLRGRKSSAYVADVLEGPHPAGITLKDILELDEDKPVLPATLITLVRFVADYYGVFVGEALSVALPATARRSARRYQLTELGQSARASAQGDERTILEIGHRFPQGFGSAAVEKKLPKGRRKIASRLRAMVQKGWLAEKKKGGGPRKVAAFSRSALPAEDLLSARQKALAELLESIPQGSHITAAELAQEHKNAYAKLKKLESLGLIERTEVEVRVRVEGEPIAPKHRPELTPAQAEALISIREHLQSDGFKAILLQGVTGSGKTEVYLRTIEEVLGAGKTALVLVPEIALTPQLGARFRARFGERVATFHSGLTVAERRDEWERIHSGEAQIGLGARSAIFLPLENLGAIIVDEEHETSFKQEESPRYHARDLAVVRGSHDGAVVILGSATPSLETLHNAQIGKFDHLVLPERVAQRPMPEVEIIDMADAQKSRDGIFSERLLFAIKQTLGRGEQVILFLNRRGYAPFVNCTDCGYAFKCESCDVSLTLHRSRDSLACHHCGFEIRVPDHCPKPGCGSRKVEAHGLGTERLEQELKALIGDVAICRLDRDTVRKRSDLNQMLGGFRRGETRLMIGTQMVTKGHDFPGVTLVGVVAADASLNFPDFRAAERTFQLLTQVAGRAGRGDIPGKVMVQTFEKDHYAIAAATTHNFDAFAAMELRAREELGYPPFSHLALLRFESAQESDAENQCAIHAKALRHAVLSQNFAVSVLGPAPAALAKLRGLWRFQILLKASSRKSLRQCLAYVPTKVPEGVRRVIDIDPVSML